MNKWSLCILSYNHYGMDEASFCESHRAHANIGKKKKKKTASENKTLNKHWDFFINIVIAYIEM